MVFKDDVVSVGFRDDFAFTVVVTGGLVVDFVVILLDGVVVFLVDVVLPQLILELFWQESSLVSWLSKIHENKMSYY